MSTIEQARGRFISFEGLDGSGKTTQIERLARRLRERGLEVVIAVEPGGTRVGEQIRAILLDVNNHGLSPQAELLLYFASRAQNVVEVIRPALARGAVVLADRFTDSTMAYQGYGRGLGEEVVRDLHRIACGDLEPDLTLLLDVEPEAGLARARGRGALNRMDDQAREFYRRVRAGYLEMARRSPERFRLLDASLGVDEVAARVWDVVASFLRL
ncbi:MAG: dTMP kinase [Bryobacteraceae bacterium]